MVDEHDPTVIQRTFLPRRNTLTIFDVSRETVTIPHSVSEVVPGVPDARIALTGWFQLVGSEKPYTPIVKHSGVI